MDTDGKGYETMNTGMRMNTNRHDGTRGGEGWGRGGLAWLLLFLGWSVSLAAAESEGDRKVLLVTLDGLRWREVFRGLDEAYLDKEKGGVAEKERPLVIRDLGAETVQARRERLMPFLWTQVAKRGLLLGNRDRGSRAAVANTAWISYPGYNELLTGHPDPLITTNFPRHNPNVTVLEWLDGRPACAGRVVACTTWQIFPYILNVTRSRFPLWVSGRHSRLDRVSPRLAEIQQWMDDITTKSRDEHFDGFAFRAALDLLQTHRPRLAYVALGEPDTWAHGRRYDKYVYSIQQCDRYLREWWEYLQSQPEYRDRTTLIITTDHGRGETPADWTNHGESTPHSDQTWMAAIGPGVPALGEVEGGEPVTQGQVAATVAALLGEDYRAAVPEAAPVLPQFRLER